MGCVMHILVEDRFRSHLEDGYIWSGWMGGQWAMTHVILSYLKPAKGLVVLCGGPGDLAYNACFQGKARFAINIDSSYTAIEYALSLGSGHKPIINYEEEITKANRKHEVVPEELVEPYLHELSDYARVQVCHVWDDALHFANGMLDELSPVDIYIASPTVFDVGGILFTFYSIYDKELSESKRIGFNQWINKSKEVQYLKALINTIKRVQPAARILFGVGEGRMLASEYMAILGGKIVYEQEFITNAGYQFTDWLLLYEP